MNDEPDPTSSLELDKDLYERNVRAFLNLVEPAMSQRIINHIPASRLVRNEDGEWDVEFRGEWLYGPGGVSNARGMAERMRGDSRTRFKLTPFATNNLDRAAGEFIYHLLKEATEEGITFAEHPESEEGYHLISFGLGLGYHLPKVIEMTKCESICIVEPNMDFLHHSLKVMDWESLLKRNMEWPSVNIIVGDTGIADRVRGACRAANPTSIDWALVVTAYPSDIMLAAHRELVRDAAMIMLGLGFLVDEAEMTRASYLNLCFGQYRLYKRQKKLLKCPAFIVGSGPSIDQDIEIIKELKDQAVIFACGTSARILLANGIEPDFMLLLENGEVPVSAMEKVAETYDVGNAVMIASNTVSPRIKKVCKETIYFFRTALSPYPIFCPGREHDINEPGPTVANTGMGAAIGLGFRELYLFGVDLGSRDPSRHHSKHSAYVKREGEGENQDILPFDTVFDHRAVGNFGGVVYTETIMEWTRDALARVISQNSDKVVVYNCSDGARIDHTIPKASEAIELTSSAADKLADKVALMAEMPLISSDAAVQRWNNAKGLENVKDLAGRIKAAAQDFGDSAPAFMRRMLPILLTDHGRLPRFEEYFLRGSVFMSLSALDFYVRRVNDPEKRKTFDVMALKEFRRFIDNIILWMEWYFEHMPEYESSLDLERDFNGLPYE